MAPTIFFIFSAYISLIINPQTTNAPTFLTHNISAISGVDPTHFSLGLDFSVKIILSIQSNFLWPEKLTHRKSWAILQNFHSFVIKLTKTHILPNCQVPNVFLYKCKFWFIFSAILGKNEIKRNLLPHHVSKECDSSTINNHFLYKWGNFFVLCLMRSNIELQ